MDKSYHRTYYENNKELMNERRLFDYYIKKFGNKLIEDMKKEHGSNALNVLKTHSRNMLKLHKLQIRKEELEKELIKCKL